MPPGVSVEKVPKKKEMTTKMPTGGGKGNSKYSNVETSDGKVDNSVCYRCKRRFMKNCNAIQCDNCDHWYHRRCVMSPDTFKKFVEDKSKRFLCYWNKCTRWCELW